MIFESLYGYSYMLYGREESRGDILNRKKSEMGPDLKLFMVNMG